MIYKELADAIRDFTRANLPEVHNRAFIMDSKQAFPDMYKTPFAGVVYAGTDPKSLKPRQGIFTHKFDLFLFRSIYREEKTIKGDSNFKGVLELNQDYYEIIEDELFCTELNSKIISAICKEVYGTESFVEIGAKGYGSAIGFRVEYIEQEF